MGSGRRKPEAAQTASYVTAPAAEPAVPVPQRPAEAGAAFGVEDSAAAADAAEAAVAAEAAAAAQYGPYAGGLALSAVALSMPGAGEPASVGWRSLSTGSFPGGGGGGDDETDSTTSTQDDEEEAPEVMMGRCLEPPRAPGVHLLEDEGDALTDATDTDEEGPP